MGAAEDLFYADTGVRSDERDRWLGARRAGFGASEAAAIVGESRWSDPGKVYAIKLGLLQEDDGLERLEWGLRHEPTILAAYSSPRYAGRRSWADRRLLRSRDWSWALCTLDAWTEAPAAIPLELKTTDSRNADDWADGCPREYFWQLQHQMLVTGAERASIACLIGPHRLVWCDVDRDDVAIRRLTRAASELWERIQNREPPETRDPRALAALYPSEDGSTIELPLDLVDLDVRRVELAEQRKAIEAELEAIDMEIKSAIGGAERGVLPGGVSYTWKTTRYAERLMPAREVRVLRRHEPPRRKDR